MGEAEGLIYLIFGKFQTISQSFSSQEGRIQCLGRPTGQQGMAETRETLTFQWPVASERLSDKVWVLDSSGLSQFFPYFLLDSPALHHFISLLHFPSLNQNMFIEYLLFARYCSGCWVSHDKQDEVPAFRELIF